MLIFRICKEKPKKQVVFIDIMVVNINRLSDNDNEVECYENNFFERYMEFKR